MNPSLPTPCPEWAESLAATHPTDLAPERRAALEAHLATCQACSAVLADYARLERAIQQIPTSRPLPAFPPQLLAAGRARRAGAAERPNSSREAPADSLRLIPQKGQTPILHGQSRGLATGLAIAAVVALFALVFHNFTASHTPSTLAGPTATSQATDSPSPTATPQASSQWVASTTPLSNERALPMLAPSNPNIIYEAYADSNPGNVTVLRRSDDGGASWQNLPLPAGKLPPIDVASIAISPLNPATVVLSLTTYSGNHPGVCKGVLVVQAAGNALARLSGSTPCGTQYLSTDSGQHWGPLSLPAAGALGAPEFNQVALPSSSDVFRTQDQRLYSALGLTNTNGSANYSQGIRIVGSKDGGIHWLFVDAALAASGQSICDFQPTSTEDTLYALTQTGSFCYDFPTSASYLWRSDDGGTTWTQVGKLPNIASNLLLVSRGAAAAPLLYALMPAHVYNPGGSQADSPPVVSADGGATWRAAPTQGIPAGATQEQGPLAVLSDGSILMSWGLQDQTSALLSWKAGASAWRPVIEHVSLGSGYLLVTSSTGKETIWVIGQSVYQGPYSVFRYEVK